MIKNLTQERPEENAQAECNEQTCANCFQHRGCMYERFQEHLASFAKQSTTASITREIAQEQRA